MAKENTKEYSRLNSKVIIFWSLILFITIVFAVLFVIRFSETRIFDSYEDINRAKLNLVVDISSEKGAEDYYVYIYSAKQDANGKLVDTSKTDIDKANEIFPTVLNYFNYVRRNEWQTAVTINKIYGYNVKNNAKDSNLSTCGLEISQLPALVKVSGNNGTVVETFTSANQIQKELSEIMNGKK